MVNRFIIALLGFYLGYATFFSFAVAPVLFSVLPKSVAGEVVAQIFPLYFGAGISILGVSSILVLREGLKKIALLLLVSTVICTIQELYIIPLAEELKATNYEAFKTLHGVSMFLNLTAMLLVWVSLGWLLKIK
ncbi:MAG TPA: DUF4149 domain-containing protein [Aquifex aeolicus]|uniref:DUF4149 domain-containing protein n=1 Tax=Aquifex aeolicus TaxID=63363 RepID=A0A9D1CES1_AQUAO|nr:DUF4149 domain-containing protein [Aquificales bacterium]HIP86401.1 DUF4149 domain-containing protein [Aquifex sp.]HIP98170.1 DUF4149 domain-containing protein [Aquifex aeolicus]HIQ26577.1 DUF4149 domain-containing protein [Aquifex aeolicus]